jgi:hypothetical protein
MFMAKVLQIPSKRRKATAAAGTSPVDFQALAASLRTALDAIPPQIPGWQISHPLLQSEILPARIATEKFIKAVTNAVAASPALQAIQKLDVAEAQEVLAFLDAFTPIVAQLAALTRDLQITMALRQANVGKQALQVYLVAKGLGRDIGGAAELTSAEQMQHALGLTGRKKRGKGVPQTTPQPSPQQQPVNDLPKAA